jgi:hypothetical protein
LPPPKDAYFLDWLIPQFLGFSYAMIRICKSYSFFIPLEGRLSDYAILLSCLYFLGVIAVNEYTWLCSIRMKIGKTEPTSIVRISLAFHLILVILIIRESRYTSFANMLIVLTTSILMYQAALKLKSLST